MVQAQLSLVGAQSLQLNRSETFHHWVFSMIVPSTLWPGKLPSDWMGQFPLRSGWIMSNPHLCGYIPGVLVFTPLHSRVLFLLLNVHPLILLQLLVSFKDVKICRVLEMGALHFFIQNWSFWMHIPGFRKRCANRGTPSSETDPILNVLNQGSREHLAHYIHPPVIKRGKPANPKKNRGLLRWENHL